MQASVTVDVALGLGIAGQKFGFEVQLADQLPDGSWEARELRASFKQKAISAGRANDATGTITGLENERRKSELLEPVGAG